MFDSLYHLKTFALRRNLGLFYNYNSRYLNDIFTTSYSVISFVTCQSFAFIQFTIIVNEIVSVVKNLLKYPILPNFPLLIF